MKHLLLSLLLLVPLAHAHETPATDIYGIGDGYSPPILNSYVDPVVEPVVEPDVDPILGWVSPVDVDGVYLVETNGVELVLSVHSTGSTFVLFVMNNSETIFDTFVGTWALGKIDFGTFDHYSSVASKWEVRFRENGDIYGVQTQCYTIFNTYDCTFSNGTEFVGAKVF